MHGVRLTCVLLVLLCGRALGQDLEPRRWTHLPTGLSFVGVGSGFSTGVANGNMS